MISLSATVKKNISKLISQKIVFYETINKETLLVYLKPLKINRSQHACRQKLGWLDKNVSRTLVLFLELRGWTRFEVTGLRSR